MPQSLSAVMFLLSSSSEVMFSRSLTVFLPLLLTFLSGPVFFLKHTNWLCDTVLTAVNFHCTVEYNNLQWSGQNYIHFFGQHHIVLLVNLWAATTTRSLSWILLLCMLFSIWYLLLCGVFWFFQCVLPVLNFIWVTYLFYIHVSVTVGKC